MKLENPLNVIHGKGKDRIKRDSGKYYVISNGMYYGKKGDGDISISKGDWVKLTKDQACSLSECIVTEKEAEKFISKTGKSLTTKSLSSDD